MEKAQQDLDLLMQDLGRRRYQAKVARNQEKQLESLSPPQMKLLSVSAQSLMTKLDNYFNSGATGKGKKYRALIAPLKSRVIAYITCKVVLDKISENAPYLSIASKISSALEDEAKFAYIKENFPIEFERELFHINSKRDLKVPKPIALQYRLNNAKDINYSWTKWKQKQKLELGQFLIEMLKSCSNLVESRKYNTVINGRQRCKEVLCPTKETLEWIERGNEFNEDTSPLYLPMVSNPRDWTNPFNGGYNENIYMKWGLVKARDGVVERMPLEQMPEVYQAINSAQQVPLEVNEDVFHVFEYMWKEDIRVSSLPPREDFIPDPIPGMDTDPELFKEYKLACLQAMKSNESNEGKRILISKIYYVAKEFLDQKFYYPYRLDFRGRFNCLPSFLTPQGNDISKSLIRFANAKAIDTEDSLDWFCIHGANVFGKDKLTYEERIEWVKNNAEFIYQIYIDPIDNLDWTKAKSPFQFLAWALEYGALQDHTYKAGKFVQWEDLKTREPFYSKIPCGIDATNSGLQIYSLILRDKAGASSTNVVDSKEVKDIYQEIADLVMKDIKDLAKNSKDKQEKSIAEGWISFFEEVVPRSAVKKIVMTIPYGLSQHSARVYLEEWYNDQLEERGMRNARPFPKTFYATMLLTKCIMQRTQETITSASQAMDWLREVALICAKENKPIEWVSPTGFIVNQKNCKNIDIKIITCIGDKYVLKKQRKIYHHKVKRARLETDEISSRKMMGSFPPNLVHSLDSAILVKALNYFTDNGAYDFLTVHDSFMCHASNLSLLSGCLRQANVDIFKNNILLDLKTQIENYTGLTLPDPPSMGELDISCVTDSRFMYS